MNGMLAYGGSAAVTRDRWWFPSLATPTVRQLRATEIAILLWQEG